MAACVPLFLPGVEEVEAGAILRWEYQSGSAFTVGLEPTATLATVARAGFPAFLPPLWLHARRTCRHHLLQLPTALPGCRFS